MWGIDKVKRNGRVYGLGDKVVYSGIFLLHLNKFSIFAGSHLM